MTDNMTNKTVYIIESNSAGNGVAALKNAQAYGYKTHFLTSMPEKYNNMDTNPMELADYVTEIDTMDVIQLLYFFEDKNPVAILTFDDFHIIPTSIIAGAKGVVGPNLNGLLNVRFKDKTREKTRNIGRSVEFSILDTDSSYTCSPIGYPCVIKPVDESGSVGVKVCNNDHEFKDAFLKIQSFYSNIIGYKYIRKLLVEEYIEGNEYSAEVCWNRNSESWDLIGITKKIISAPPNCIELGHIFPHLFEEKLEMKVVETLRNWLSAVGLNNCFAHIEFKIVDDEPVLIEINPRPAGGYINKLVSHVYQEDLTKHYLDMVLNKPIRIPVNKQIKYSSIKFILPPKKGELINVNIPKEKEGIDEYKIISSQKKIDEISNGDHRIGYVISSGSSVSECLYNCNKFVEELEFSYKLEEDKDDE